jgi:hypothetical protein
VKDKEGERATYRRDRERGSERERELNRERDSMGEKTLSQTTNGDVI